MELPQRLLAGMLGSAVFETHSRFLTLESSLRFYFIAEPRNGWVSRAAAFGTGPKRKSLITVLCRRTTLRWVLTLEEYKWVFCFI